MTQPPLIAVPTDVKAVDGYIWHAANEIYLKAVTDVAGCIPVLVPSLGDKIEINALLDRVDGVMITGSRSNVHPSYYGEDETEETGPHDLARDATAMPLIRATIERGIPLLAICRGIQELNVAFGGSLISEVQDLDGRMDHRAPLDLPNDERFAIKHGVSIVEGGCLGRILGADEIQVNTVHRQAVGRLSDRLTVEATAPDGTIEAVSVKNAKGFAVGVQWHPEYWAATDSPSRALFEAFGSEARSQSRRSSASGGAPVETASTAEASKYAQA